MDKDNQTVNQNKNYDNFYSLYVFYCYLFFIEKLFYSTYNYISKDIRLDKARVVSIIRPYNTWPLIVSTYNRLNKIKHQNGCQSKMCFFVLLITYSTGVGLHLEDTCSVYVDIVVNNTLRNYILYVTIRLRWFLFSPIVVNTSALKFFLSRQVYFCNVKRLKSSVKRRYCII